MPINKHSFACYQVIDACIRNRQRSYPDFGYLIERCSKRNDQHTIGIIAPQSKPPTLKIEFTKQQAQYLITQNRLWLLQVTLYKTDKKYESDFHLITNK